MRSKTARLSPLRPRTTSHPAALYALHLLCHVFSEASINKSTHVGQPVFSVLFALLSLAGDSPPASKRTKIPRKSKAVRCEAVLPEQKCSQTRKRPQRILCVFSRALTRYEGISARQNRVRPCQSTQALMDMPSRRGAFPDAAKTQPRSSAVCICEGSGLRFFRLAAGRRAPCPLSILRPASEHTPSCFAT